MSETWTPGRASRLLDVNTDAWEASSLGNVRTTDRTLASGRRVGGKVLALQLDKDGYPTVKLAGKRVRVCVLVALAFHGKPECRHLNGIRDDSRPENLVWGSHWENEGDKKRIKQEGLGHFDDPPLRSRTVAETGLIRLSAAVERDIISGTLSSVRKASHYDPLFPEVRGMAGLARLYDTAELMAWDQVRHPWAWELP